MIKILRKASHVLPDRFYIRLKFKKNIGKWPNLKNPKTFNEKMQWLKLHDRDPAFTDMVDKHLVKKIVGDKIGYKYVIEEYGVWDNFDQIDFSKLPDRFVLKATHDCGGVVICKSKKEFDKIKAKRFLELHLKSNYFYEGREWPYKHAKPMILAEAFEGNPETRLVVYKVMCFHGEPRIIQVIQDDKTKNESVDYFDTKWNQMNLRTNYPNSKTPVLCPECLEQMLELSKELSRGRPFLRVDWYEANGKLKFSEFTFYSDAGWAAFHPDKWDQELGDWIKLPHSDTKTEAIK